MKKILAWHFIKANKKERFYPHRKIKVGETLTCDPDKLSLCNYGLHASIKPLDALSFVDWEDAIICRVELSGKILIEDNKLCAERRKVLWMANADKTLREFAIYCAENVLHIFEKEYPNDDRPRKAIQASKDYLNKKISKEELCAAWAAAWDAASAAAWDAASFAASSAASAAAWDAAWDAASSAASSAASAAAWDAAWTVERDKQNKKLHKMLMKLKLHED